MAETIPVDLGAGFYQSDALPLSAQTAINWYPVYSETQTLSPSSLFGTPGIDPSIDSGVGEINRGAQVMAEVPYFINGEILYKLVRTFDGMGNEVFNLENKGTVPGDGRVSLANNGIQLCIVVPGDTAFIYNQETDVFEEITDPDFTANGIAEGVVFIDGYFVFFAAKKFFNSALNDGLSYDALDFGTAEADPDDIKGILVFNSQLFIFGSLTIEVFQNVGGAGFPFQRISGFFISKGLDAQFSTISFNDGFCFIGGGENEKPSIWFFSGSGLQRISTIPIETVLANKSDTVISEVFTWTYADVGSYFVGFTLDDTTFVYDATASRLSGKKIWHERRSVQDNLLTRNRINSMVQAYGRVIVGDARGGRLGSLNNDAFNEYGEILARQAAFTPLSAQGDAIFVSKVEVTMESGLSELPDEVEPVIGLDWSDDARTFNQRLDRPLGLLGEYDRRVYWHRTGRAPRFRVYRLTMTDPVKPTIVEANLRVDIG